MNEYEIPVPFKELGSPVFDSGDLETYVPYGLLFLFQLAIVVILDWEDPTYDVVIDEFWLQDFTCEQSPGGWNFYGLKYPMILQCFAVVKNFNYSTFLAGTYGVWQTVQFILPDTDKCPFDFHNIIPTLSATPGGVTVYDVLVRFCHPPPRKTNILTKPVRLARKETWRFLWVWLNQGNPNDFAEYTRFVGHFEKAVN